MIVFMSQCMINQYRNSRENTPVVGKSAGEKVIKSCLAYENTTSFTATRMSLLYFNLN